MKFQVKPVLGVQHNIQCEFTTYSITNLSGITISDEVGANSSSGALASNYTLTGGTHSFTINPKAVDIVGSREYDGTTNISASDISVTGTVNSETLACQWAWNNFVRKCRNL